jgi:hypothetical protein
VAIIALIRSLRVCGGWIFQTVKTPPNPSVIIADRARIAISLGVMFYASLELFQVGGGRLHAVDQHRDETAPEGAGGHGIKHSCHGFIQFLDTVAIEQELEDVFKEPLGAMDTSEAGRRGGFSYSPAVYGPLNEFLGSYLKFILSG